MGQKRTRTGPGAHQEWARSAPGVARERTRAGPGAHQEWAETSPPGAGFRRCCFQEDTAKFSV